MCGRAPPESRLDTAVIGIGFRRRSPSERCTLSRTFELPVAPEVSHFYKAENFRRTRAGSRRRSRSSNQWNELMRRPRPRSIVAQDVFTNEVFPCYRRSAHSDRIEGHREEMQQHVTVQPRARIYPSPSPPRPRCPRTARPFPARMSFPATFSKCSALVAGVAAVCSRTSAVYAHLYRATNSHASSNWKERPVGGSGRRNRAASSAGRNCDRRI
ncbi:MAG: hypothetical protein JWM87_2508 [Candidatus Eremiobacteraeota bacterium]|nr:hypothetical protein [Candidatus Eremiobacteraeota bacterium]